MSSSLQSLPYFSLLDPWMLAPGPAWHLHACPTPAPSPPGSMAQSVVGSCAWLGTSPRRREGCVVVLWLIDAGNTSAACPWAMP